MLLIVAIVPLSTPFINCPETKLKAPGVPSLTLIESVKLVFINEEASNVNYVTNNLFVLSPIILGTFITGCASVIKFNCAKESQFS